MSRNVFFLPCLLGLLILARPTTATAQHVVGGGDPLMMLFSEGQFDAVRMLENIAAHGMPATVDPVIATRLATVINYNGTMMPRSAAMAKELASASQVWRDTDIGLNKCAAINLDRQVPPTIILSLPTCRAMLSISPAGGGEAVKTLLHEVSHRFGLGTSDTDELFATRIAVAVFNVWKNARSQGQPFWTETAGSNAMTARINSTAVWSGAGPSTHQTRNQLILWGGCDDSHIPGADVCSRYPVSGARLEILKDADVDAAPTLTWLPMDEDSAPLGRRYHTAVWTGDASLPTIANKMLIFGGCRGVNNSCNQSLAVTACDNGSCNPARPNNNMNNNVYDLKLDKWQALSATNAPTARIWHTAVWTQDNQMLIWGGLANYQSPAGAQALGNGGILQFDSSSRGAETEGHWLPFPQTANTPSPRFGHAAIWTGEEMIIWGGCARKGPTTRCPEPLNDGALFNPNAAPNVDKWRRLPPAPFAARDRFSAIWTGRYLIIWGGQNGTNVLSDGGIFDMNDFKWHSLANNLPPGETGRKDHQAFFEPLRGRMIIWGGTKTAAATGASDYPSTTLVYDIEQKTWSQAATPTDPLGRVNNVGAWIQDSLFVWGGYSPQGGILTHGGIFNP